MKVNVTSGRRKTRVMKFILRAGTGAAEPKRGGGRLSSMDLRSFTVPSDTLRWPPLKFGGGAPGTGLQALLWPLPSATASRMGTLLATSDTRRVAHRRPSRRTGAQGHTRLRSFFTWLDSAAGGLQACKQLQANCGPSPPKCAFLISLQAPSHTVGTPMNADWESIPKREPLSM